MTAPTFRAKDNGSGQGAADVVLTKPTGTVNNDILLAAVVCDPGQTLAPPGGWTELYSDPADNFGIWWKRAASEGASYTFVATGGSNPRIAVGTIVGYKDCPTDISPTIGVVTKQTSVSVKGASVTPPTQGAIILHIGACVGTVNEVVTSTPPVGFKERDDFQAVDDPAQVQVAISEAYVLPHGPTGDRIATLSVSKQNWGVQVILYQTPLSAGTSDGAGQETLVELTHWDEIAAAETTKKYSSRGIIFSGGEFYEGRILGPVEVSQNAADLIAVGGQVATTVSSIVLNNKDGALDTIHRRMTAIGRALVIKTVKVTSGTDSAVGAGAASNAVTVFAGIVAALTPSGTNMMVSVSDLAERFDTPLQIDEYPGTSGLGGNTELKGLTKPLTFGRCFNIWPQELGNFTLGDGSLYTFQASSRPINDIVAVYERGVLMTSIGTAPGAGQYREWLSDGVFQLGFTPNGIITCTVKGDDPASDIYANQHGEVITRMLTTFGPLLATSNLETSTFTAIDALISGEIGIHFRAGDRTLTREAVGRVLRSGGIWLAGGRNGKLRLSMSRPVATERIRLTEPDIVSLRPVSLPSSLQPAPITIDIESEINWHPLTDISSSVTGSLRRQLSGHGRTVTATSNGLSARQKVPRTWTIKSLWFDDTSAQAQADQIIAWVEQGLQAIEVVTDRYRNTVEIGYACEIDSYPRFGLDLGFAGIVAGWREAPAKGRVTLLLIGSSVTDGNELREDSSPELREDGTEELRE